MTAKCRNTKTKLWFRLRKLPKRKYPVRLLIYIFQVTYPISKYLVRLIKHFVVNQTFFAPIFRTKPKPVPQFALC